MAEVVVSPSSVVAVLAAVGVRASFDSGGLSLAGPEEALTPELIEFVQSHRAELVDFLLEAIRSRPPVAHDFDATSPPRWPSGVFRCPQCYGLMSQPEGQPCAVCRLNDARARRWAS